MQVTFMSTPGDARAQSIVIPHYKGDQSSAPFKEFDDAAGGAISRAIETSRYGHKVGETLTLHALPGIDAARVVVLGLGAKEDATANSFERAGASAVRALLMSGLNSAVLRLDGLDADAQWVARAAFGAQLASYRFDTYRTKLSDDRKPALETITIVADDVGAVEPVWARYAGVFAGVELARDLVSEPPNILHPEEFARRINGLTERGLEVEVLGEADMAKLGMGALLGVGQGSVRESQLAIMRWNGGAEGEAPIAFVGKGVTFDTGGISLKPGPGMEDMKGDMGGAAAVTGLMCALATRKAKVNAIGIVGLVENMPDGNAQRPGDIVTSMSGQTIEILNTDAEGRLVLADALWYCQDRFKPKFMVDLATLTGAMIISLANHYAGLFASDDELANQLLAAGLASDEKLWRMPMGPAYDKMIDSKVADMKNIGGPPGGSITAAQFLKRYTNDTPWAHLDIAPTAWKAKNDDPREPTWATGFGVRVLEQFVAQNYEDT